MNTQLSFILLVVLSTASCQSMQGDTQQLDSIETQLTRGDTEEKVQPREILQPSGTCTQVGAFFASKNNCKGYYQCIYYGQKPIFRHCQKNGLGNMMWNPIKNVCDHEGAVSKIRPECKPQYGNILKDLLLYDVPLKN